MEETARRVALAGRLARRLQEFLAGLSQEQWRRPSACELWEVRDVVSHLTGGAERQIESMRRGRGGDASPPQGFVPLEAAAMSAGNARRDIDLRERLGDELLATFAARYDRLNAMLAGFGPGEWEVPCWHAGRGQMTAREYVDLRIQELAVHDWDIRSAIEPEAHLERESVPVLVDIAATWLSMSFRPGPNPAAPAKYRFEVTGAAGRRQDVIVQGDEFQVGAMGDSEPDVVVRCDGEAYLLFMYGRLSASNGAASGRLAVDGGLAMLGRFEEWFKGL